VTKNQKNLTKQKAFIQNIIDIIYFYGKINKIINIVSQ